MKLTQPQPHFGQVISVSIPTDYVTKAGVPDPNDLHAFKETLEKKADQNTAFVIGGSAYFDSKITLYLLIAEHFTKVQELLGLNTKENGLEIIDASNAKQEAEFDTKKFNLLQYIKSLGVNEMKQMTLAEAQKQLDAGTFFEAQA